MALVKPFLKKLKTFLEENGKADRVESFQKGAQNFIKNIVANYDDWEFYTGASEKLDGSLVCSFWEDESATGPMFYLFKDCLKEIKC